MTRTLFWFWYLGLHGIWVVGGTYQASCNCCWHWSICPTVAPKYRSDMCQVSIGRSWQLALCQNLLLITFQPRTHNYGVHKDGNYWASYCQLDMWLVMYVWDIMDKPLCSQQSCAQWFSSLWTLCQPRASCHLPSDTWHLTVSVSGYNTLGQMRQMLKYQRWLRGGLVCTICYYVPCIHQIQNSVLGIKVFVTQFFIFVVLYLCYGMLHLICHRWMCGM